MGRHCLQAVIGLLTEEGGGSVDDGQWAANETISGDSRENECLTIKFLSPINRKQGPPYQAW